ncbi:hypothetical protein PR002_g9438 [Phytophthora rubi]|uniref:Uncharacterized protein n=1 Tax=Phytophthora rubi TaxID=129364 RepID=A0A6A3MR46_9STRA|nr:hypothetical protein PR002_g9438 [Phytophthora rubi]
MLLSKDLMLGGDMLLGEDLLPETATDNADQGGCLLAVTTTEKNIVKALRWQGQHSFQITCEELQMAERITWQGGYNMTCTSLFLITPTNHEETMTPLMDYPAGELCVGDVIEYYCVAFVAGDPRGHRRATVL